MMKNLFFTLESVMSIILTLYFMWSLSPSMSLLFLLLTSLISGLILYKNMIFQIHILMIMLIIIGGLFVLISFVILSFPKDLNLMYKNLSSIFMFFSLLSFFFLSKEKKEIYLSSSMKEEMELFSSQIFSESSLSFIFLIFLLLMMLKLVDILMELSKKKLFLTK